MNSVLLRRWSLTLHNWMGLIVGIQIIFWFVGGLVMTVLPLDLVRGERSMAEQTPVTIAPSEMANLLQGFNVGDIRSVSSRSVAGTAVVQVTMASGQSQIFDATTGVLLSPISEDLAVAVALEDFQYRVEDRDAAITVVASEWITEEPGDFRRKLPVWRVSLDDPDGTRIYVSPETGRVLARRNDYWRVFDFFWMLHIMDYDEREDFNHPLLIVTTLTSTLFVLTGVILLYFRFWPGARRKKSS